MNKKLLVALIIMFMSKHPSTMCLSLVIFCVMMSFYLKSIVSNVNIYVILIIFVGGILLLLFYLTVISTNKPSWYFNFFLSIVLLPEFLMIKNLKFSSISFCLESFNGKNVFFLILLMLLLMLLLLCLMFIKMNFMRKLN